MTLLMVALDAPNSTQAIQWVQALKDLPIIFKVGLELFTAEGPKIVEKIKMISGRPVFLDLKLYDIPNTVRSAVVTAAQCGADYLTIHLSGGEKMVRSALEAATLHPTRPTLLGVSVLTSFDSTSWASAASMFAPAKELFSIETVIQNMAHQAAQWGLPGIVCSPQELLNIQKSAPNLKTVVPGIRKSPLTGGDDQARVLSPKEAAQNGAFAIVVGRPITQTTDPRATALSILEDLS